jgi:hypothetical protein
VVKVFIFLGCFSLVLVTARPSAAVTAEDTPAQPRQGSESAIRRITSPQDPHAAVNNAVSNAVKSSLAKNASGFPFGKPLTLSQENFTCTIVINKLGDNEYETSGTISITCPYGSIKSWSRSLSLVLYSNTEVVEKIYLRAKDINKSEYKVSTRFKTDKTFNKVGLAGGWKIYYRD